MAYTCMAYIGMAYIVMACIVMVYIGMAYTVMACIVMAYIVVACIFMAYMIMAYVVMACITMAYIVMACMVMACMVMAYIVMVVPPTGKKPGDPARRARAAARQDSKAARRGRGDAPGPGHHGGAATRSQADVAEARGRRGRAPRCRTGAEQHERAQAEAHPQSSDRASAAGWH